MSEEQQPDISEEAKKAFIPEAAPAEEDSDGEEN